MLLRRTGGGSLCDGGWVVPPAGGAVVLPVEPPLGAAAPEPGAVPRPEALARDPASAAGGDATARLSLSGRGGIERALPSESMGGVAPFGTELRFGAGRSP